MIWIRKTQLLLILANAIESIKMVIIPEQLPSHIIIKFNKAPTMSKQAHQPARFDVFTELKDKSGFTIPGCSHVFKYDRYGGWFDEYSNYYDTNGNPEDPPSDDAYSDDGSKSHHSSDVDDEYEREFGRPKDYDDEEDDPSSIHLEKIAANMEELRLYPSNGPFRVHFKNLGYFSKREEVFNWYQSKVPDILNLIFFNNQKGFNGNGYFVVNSIKAGEQLIKLEGEKYGDREIYFVLDSVEDFLLTPLEPHELKADFSSKGKKYVKKSEVGKQETSASTAPVSKPSEGGAKPKHAYVKIEENQSRYEKPIKLEEKILAPIEIKPIKLEEKIQAPVEFKQTKLNPDDFGTYQFNKKAFPKKSSFKQWLSIHKYSDDDYKTVQKIVGNEEFAKIIMKNKIYLNLNNSVFNGEKIVFTPL